MCRVPATLSGRFCDYTVPVAFEKIVRQTLKECWRQAHPPNGLQLFNLGGYGANRNFTGIRFQGAERTAALIILFFLLIVTGQDLIYGRLRFLGQCAGQ